MNATHKSPERAFALQKYLLLHSQHDALEKHLNQLNPSRDTSRSPDRSYHSAITSPSHSQAVSLSSSPESPSYLSYAPSDIRHQRRCGSIPAALTTPSRPRIIKRRSSLPTVIDESILGEIEEEEGKMKGVNEQIKVTLTDLLNCESVRKDNRYRMWVQTRLMDTERELKGQRTRSCTRRRESDAGAF